MNTEKAPEFISRLFSGLFGRKEDPEDSPILPPGSLDETISDDHPESEKKSVKLAKLESTQMWSPVKDIKDGIILTKNGRYVQILEFAPINFTLLPEREREQIADSFGASIRVFPSKFQIKIISRQANVDGHIRDLTTCMEKEQNLQCRKMQEDSIRLIHQAATTGVSRRFLIAYQYEEPKGLRRPSWDDIVTSMNFTGQQIAICLNSAPCNNALLSELGNSDHALDVLYECMCRREAAIKPIE